MRQTNRFLGLTTFPVVWVGIANDVLYVKTVKLFQCHHLLAKYTIVHTFQTCITLILNTSTVCNVCTLGFTHKCIFSPCSASDENVYQ